CTHDILLDWRTPSRTGLHGHRPGPTPRWLEHQPHGWASPHPAVRPNHGKRLTGWARCTVPTPFVSLAQYDRGGPTRSLPMGTSVPEGAISSQVRGAVRIPTWF